WSKPRGRARNDGRGRSTKSVSSTTVFAGAGTTSERVGSTLVSTEIDVSLIATSIWIASGSMTSTPRLPAIVDSRRVLPSSGDAFGTEGGAGDAVSVKPVSNVSVG